MMRYRLMVTFAVVFAVATSGGADERQAPPSLPLPPEAQVAEAPPLDDAPAPAHRGSAARVMPAPEEARGAEEGSVVDLRLVPRAALPDPDAPPRFHIQGQYLDSKGRDLVKEPLVESRTLTPEAEPPVHEATAAKAFGATVTAWDAQGFSGWIPPDEVFAVGPEYILEAVNSGFSVRSKSGRVTTAYTDFEGFVNLPSPWNGFCYDPRAVYDSYLDRYVMTIMGRDDTYLTSYIWLLVSTTGDPNGTWYRWRFNVSRGGAGAEEWLDFSALGVDSWGIYFTGNYFTFATGSFTTAAMWSNSRGYMTGSSSSNYYWSDLRWPNNNKAFSVQPAHPHSTNGAGGTFLVNSYSGSGNQVCLWTLTGKRFPADTNPTAVGLSNVAITARQYYATGMNVNQPGSATHLDGGDARITNAVYWQGLIYGALGFDPDADGSNAEVYVFALTTAGAKSWDYTIWSTGYYYTYPSMTVNANDTSAPNWVAGLTITSDANTVYASSAAFVRDTDSATNSFTYDRAGLGAYVRLDTGGRNRWGDYSLSQFDPSCDNVWSVQQYATAGNTWITRIFGRTIADEDPCRYLHVDYPNGGESVTAGVGVGLQWDKLNLPGSDELWFAAYDGNFYWDGPYATSLGSHTWYPPNIQANDIKLMVGAWSGSAWTVQDYSDADFTINGRPDLDVTGFSGQGSAYPGASFSVANTVANIGPVTATGNAPVKVFLSTNTICSTADTQVGSRTVSNLAAGGSSAANTSVTIPPGTIPGAYYLCLWADAGPSPVITEYDEDNNTAYYSFTVSNPSIFADAFESGGSGAWDTVVP